MINLYMILQKNPLIFTSKIVFIHVSVNCLSWDINILNFELIAKVFKKQYHSAKWWHLSPSSMNDFTFVEDVVSDNLIIRSHYESLFVFLIVFK